jgi:hypothetical protein
MKYKKLARRISPRLATTCFAFLLFAPGAASAAECPASSPEDPQERRKLAKEWFGTAEAAENGGNDVEAIRAYACSYKMVAHPFTAYNLGRVSERNGDNELALKMFKAYLTLKPDAQDKEEVKGKVKALEEKMASGNASGPTENANAEEGGEKTPEPPQEELAPPPQPKPAQVVQTPKPAETEPENPSHAVEWIVGGASAAALVVGVGLNLAARSKMSACQADASKNPPLYASANTECDSARPLAYTSYALLSVGAVGAAVDAVLIYLRHRGDGDSSSGDDSSVGFLLLPGGGGALTARGRF